MFWTILGALVAAWALFYVIIPLVFGSALIAAEVAHERKAARLSRFERRVHL